MLGTDSAPLLREGSYMRGHKDALLATLLGFAVTSAVMLPPVLAQRAEKAARIADHDLSAGETAVEFGQKRQARLARLLRDLDKTEAAASRR
ncbi:MAG: hypothetical protein C0471_14645 [Erythrobacter sp.]|nr:hypothetical protein [Erythrobacter sp.]